MIHQHPIIALWPHFLLAATSGATAAYESSGHGDKDRADDAAVNAIRRQFSTIPMKGVIEIGEGERDDAPMLYIGEEVGLGYQHHDSDFPEVSIAIDPLEGTGPCSKGQPGAIAIMAWSERHGILQAADGYMEKLVVGPSSKGVVDLNRSVEENLEAIAEKLDRPVSSLVVAVLDRPRNYKTIDAIRLTKAKVKLINDGDLSESINAMVAGKHVHAVMGSGGAPEGHIAAAAARCLNGEIQGRYLHPDELNEKDRKKISDDFCDRMASMGIEFNRVYRTEELAPGQTFGVVLANVTDGVLDGHAVRQFSHGSSVSWSVMMHCDGRSWLVPASEVIEISNPKTAFRIR